MWRIFSLPALTGRVSDRAILRVGRTRFAIGATPTQVGQSADSYTVRARILQSLLRA